MNKRQRIVQRRFLDNEEAVIKRLNQVYGVALQDVTAKSKKLYDDIAKLTDELDKIEDEAEREVLKSRIRSKVYQKNYQDGLKKQISDIIDNMHEAEYKTVSEYLDKCYEDGFVGAMYDLQGQGIPLCFPIDQESVTRAVQLDSKISIGLYEHFGEDAAQLKKHITAQVSRGIATGMSYSQIARNLSGKMTGNYKGKAGGSLAYAQRIARTEGHRIQCQAAMDCCYKAKDMGADVVKQWDSTLDARTRNSHIKVDGEVKELDEKFSNGLMFPGDPNGVAAEVIHCRCALLERARWAVGGSFTKMNNFTKQLEEFESPEAYEDFKKAFFSKENKQYMNYVGAMEEKYGTKNFEKLLGKMNDREYNRFMDLQSKSPLYNKNAPLTKTGKSDIITVPKNSADSKYNEILKSLNINKVDYNPVESHKKPLTESEIIKAIAGGDLTKGSCASVGLAYIGQKQGLNVLDFRDGTSRQVFAGSFNLHRLSEMQGIKALRAKGACSLTVGNRLLKQCEVGKEYYLCVGKHAAIVKKTPEGVLQYLELQSSTRSGWTNFDGNPRYTLNQRFGCTQKSSASELYDFMIDIDESDFTTDDFKSLLGFINTADDKQRKGSYGTIK